MHKQQYDECLWLVAGQRPADGWTAWVAARWYPSMCDVTVETVIASCLHMDGSYTMHAWWCDATIVEECFLFAGFVQSG
jgi:hypothetical protein